MNNCFGFYLILTSGHEPKLFQRPRYPAQPALVLVVVRLYNIPSASQRTHQTLTFPHNQVQPPAIPGAEFANNIATSVENTSSSIVVNLEKFANAIVPPPPKVLMNQHAKEQIAFVPVMHVPVHVPVFHALVHVQVEADIKMSFLKKIVSKPKFLWSLHVPWRRQVRRHVSATSNRTSGKGVMVINANTVLHLNQTATAFAYYFMQGLPQKDVLTKIRRMYRVNADIAKADYEKLVYTISTLAQTEKIDPVTFLEIEKEEPFTYQYSAPLRMDLALTFRCQNDCVHCYAGGPHETPELTTAQWKSVIDKLSEIGVFIVTFTGGEPTLREDLPELLLYAQNKGMVTGLISNGRRLKDKAYVDTLEKSGLDFVQITLESHKPKVHDLMTSRKGSWKETVAGIQNAVQSQIYVSTNTTLSKHNATDFLTTIDYIKGLGVNAFGCNSLIYSGKAPDASDEFALSTDDSKDPSTENQRQSPTAWLKVPLVHSNTVLRL